MSVLRTPAVANPNSSSELSALLPCQLSHQVEHGFQSSATFCSMVCQDQSSDSGCQTPARAPPLLWFCHQPVSSSSLPRLRYTTTVLLCCCMYVHAFMILHSAMNLVFHISCSRNCYSTCPIISRIHTNCYIHQRDILSAL